MSKWRRIDVSVIDDKEIASNLSVYRKTKRIDSDAMSDYVDAAMSSGNHLAFAREFIDTFIKCGEYDLPYDALTSLAKRKVEEYFSRKEAETSSKERGLSREQKKTVKMHSKLQAPYYMKDTAWRSPSCFYYDKSEGNCKSEPKTGKPEQASGKKSSIRRTAGKNGRAVPASRGMFLFNMRLSWGLTRMKRTIFL